MAKKSGNFYVPDEAKLAFVIRIRGWVKQFLRIEYRHNVEGKEFLSILKGVAIMNYLILFYTILFTFKKLLALELELIFLTIWLPMLLWSSL